MFDVINAKVVKVVMVFALTALLLTFPTISSVYADGQCELPPTNCTG